MVDGDGGAKTPASVERAVPLLRDLNAVRFILLAAVSVTSIHVTCLGVPRLTRDRSLLSFTTGDHQGFDRHPTGRG